MGRLRGPDSDDGLPVSDPWVDITMYVDGSLGLVQQVVTKLPAHA